MNLNHEKNKVVPIFPKLSIEGRLNHFAAESSQYLNQRIEEAKQMEEKNNALLEEIKKEKNEKRRD